MAVNSVSPGSYNSPSVQPQAQAQRAPEKTSEAPRDNKNMPPPPPERAAPTVNTSGQTVGTVVNTKA